MRVERYLEFVSWVVVHEGEDGVGLRSTVDMRGVHG